MDAIVSMIVPYTMLTIVFALTPFPGAAMVVMVQFIFSRSVSLMGSRG
jgi:hypothetical protein